YDDYLGRGGTLVQEYRMVRPDDGRIVWVRDDCTIVTDEVTGRQVVQGVMVDVTAQKILESQLRGAEAKNRALVEQIPGIVYIEPLEGNPEPPFVSSAVESVLGITRDEWLEGQWWSKHIGDSDRERVREAREALFAGQGSLRLEYRMTTNDEREVWMAEVADVVYNGGRPWMVQGLLTDITSRKVAEQQLEFRAYHDALTGLSNRSLFEEHLEQALSRAFRQNLAVGVLFIDVDEFKSVNDRFGHHAGDEALKVLASRLLRSVRASDLVARRGGDEFLVLLPDIQPEGTHGTAFREHAGAVVGDVIKRIEEAVRSPLEIADDSVLTHLSIGCCIYPFDASDARSIMATADAAMYRSKQVPGRASPASAPLR
ncbi:MAG: diguanylate cyclase domain-containing protein, partial [Acidimicrobiales bacterium]